jgi:Tfp pilus assembly major pilin PilA
MKVFGVAIVVVVALAVVSAIGLSLVQETVAQAYSTGADRLDQQESVNFYGR